jgi:hypothetical protein
MDPRLFLGLGLLPPGLAAILCFTRLFWTVALVGMWFLFLCLGIRSDQPTTWSFFLVLGALAMALAPFIGWASTRGDSSTAK